MVSIILIALGVICFVYYIAVSCYVGFSLSFYLIWPLLSIFLWINAWFCRKDIWKILPKWGTRMYFAVIIIGMLCFLVSEGFVFSGMHAKPEKDTQYVVVLGAQVRGTMITRTLRMRLDAAYAYYLENPDVIFVLSGGQGEGEDISEAQAMSEWLAEHGVPREQLILEDRSTTTKENMTFSYEKIRDHLTDVGASDVPETRIAVCSNDFHVFRAVRLAKAAGFTHVSGLAGESDLLLLPSMLLREAAAVVKELLMGNF